MLNVYSQLRRLAASQLAVLIVGETGTGKDLAAATLHAWSQRSGKPLLTLNCTALPESLAESELFGHVRGAFSGAVGDRAGLFESAEGGTVFLDEIGDLPLTLQPKLLRVLENKSVTRIGSVQERPVDVRIVAATHRELAAEVRKNRFREDLFYRLGAAMVRVPPLRERPGELSLLAREFLCQARADLGREMFPITDGAMQRLAAHRWRGNVRELKNVMAYVATLFDGPVTDVHINHAFDSNSTSATLSATNDQDSNEFVGSLRDERDQLERRRIQAAIAQCNGNKTRAARALGLPLRTLTWKLRRYATRGA
jgi:transcriptional regulator with GAF, ATPase, and Fis domain